ncbi:MAG: hypothetical protein HKN37_09500 [Rhodothermales bacterium]|nr:hypothetical protein [Rhodothermales bacterium]
MQVEPTSEPVRALLDRLIDYAGLFPPASLDFDTSVRYFGQYLTGIDRWMLRSFVCPVSRLPDLTKYAYLFESCGGVRISVLGPPATTEAAWRSDCTGTLQTADAFNRSMAGLATADTFELKLPAAVAETKASLERNLEHLVDGALDRNTAEYFVELVPAARDPRTSAQVVSDLRQRHGDLHLGLKIRTGGVTPDAVPAARDVARFVCECRDHHVPFKATAGLHHPLYHFSADVGTDMHGFLNVFVGAIVASRHNLSPDRLTELLVTSSPPEIDSAGDGLLFKGHNVSIEDIKQTRDKLAVSFGSCSFDDPRNDLLGLGLVRLTP